MTNLTQKLVIGAVTLLPAALISGAGFAVTGTSITQLLYLGAATTVYAGAGAVVVRGARAVCAVRL